MDPTFISYIGQSYGLNTLKIVDQLTFDKENAPDLKYERSLPLNDATQVIQLQKK